ncbi:MAG: hypothetical protein QOG52_1796 [Frankiaceae bacterium]|nr:hypothetical protein [Frankiaceae bacterium]
MTEIATEPATAPVTAPQHNGQPSWRRSRRVWVAALVAGLVVTAGGVAAEAGSPAVSRNENGVVGIDLSQVRAVYEGHYISYAEVQKLNDSGRAMVSVNNRELACQGISLYFDTEDQRQAYIRDFEVRNKAIDRSATTGDPCAPFANSPRFAPPAQP